MKPSYISSFKISPKHLWKSSSVKADLVFTGEWGGLLWPSVPGGWPAAGTLQGGLLPAEGTNGAAGQGLSGQHCLRGGGLWHRHRWVFVHIHYMYVCFSATLIITPVLYKLFYLHIFNAAFSSLDICVIFLSDSQPTGHLLDYRQPGHSSACKHMEVPHQVSTAHAHVYTHVFCSCTVISSVILDWPLCY